MCFGYTAIEFVYFFVKVGISSIYSFLSYWPPLLDAMAGVVGNIMVVKIDNVIPAAMKESALIRYIIVVWIHDFVYRIWERNLRFLNTDNSNSKQGRDYLIVIRSIFPIKILTYLFNDHEVDPYIS